MSVDPPPIVREREVLVFKNGYGELYDDEVISPSGAPGRYLRWRWGLRGVLAIPVRGGAVAVVPAFRYPAGAVLLEFPRGAAEPDEPIVDAALRELREESGLHASRGEHIGKAYPDAGLLEGPVEVVVAHVDDGRAETAEPETLESFAAPIWLSRDEAGAAVASGRITCGLTLAAMAMLWLRP